MFPNVLILFPRSHFPKMSQFPTSPNVPTDPYSFDLPEDISSGLGSSFASILELAGAHADNGELGEAVVTPR